MPDAALISVVLPVHNQAGHVGTVVREYLDDLRKVPVKTEFILVPNGCRDDSAAVCARLAQSLDQVRAVESARGGWGLAVRTGLRAARGGLLCYTNLARTTTADLTLMLLYACAYPKAVVKANRKIRESLSRRIGSLLYNIQCRTLFDLSCWDINGTPKVFPRSFDKLLELTRDDDLIDAEFNIVCRRERYPMIEVPVMSYRRHGGKSTTNLRSAIRMYAGAWKMWRSLLRKPS